MPFSQGKDSSQQDILSDTVRNMKSTLTKYSYLYMEDLEDNDVFKKQPYSSIVYNSMKKLYQTNNYQFHTFCVGLHYF